MTATIARGATQPLRRQLLLAAAAALSGGTSFAQAPAAGAFPDKPIRMVVTFPPGGSADAVVRMLVPRLNERLGQPVVVDNRGGASGVIAAVAVKRAEADGHTLLMQYSGYHVISPHVTKQKAQWVPEDFRAVANVLSAPQVVVVLSLIHI